MEKNMYTRLKKRFDDCYSEYVCEVLEMDKEQIFEAASEILAVKEVYAEMRLWLYASADESSRANVFKQPLSEDDVNYMHSLENPLTFLAKEWWFHTICNKASFQTFYEMFMQSKRQPA